MNEPTTTVWVTKYALTKGIYTEDAVVAKGGRSAWMPKKCRSFWGSEFHLTRAAAVARAQEMRTKKIASLRKQIAKLEAMDFSEDVK